MNKDKIIGQLEVIESMTENEGIKQLCFVMKEVVNSLDKKPLGFSDKEDKQ